MTSSFDTPIFSERNLEFRLDGDTICIDGSAKGLQQLSDYLCELIRNPDQGHIHLDNPVHKLLTERSMKAVVAIFVSQT